MCGVSVYRRSRAWWYSVGVCRSVSVGWLGQWSWRGSRWVGSSVGVSELCPSELASESRMGVSAVSAGSCSVELASEFGGCLRRGRVAISWPVGVGVGGVSVGVGAVAYRRRSGVCGGVPWASSAAFPAALSVRSPFGGGVALSGLRRRSVGSGDSAVTTRVPLRSRMGAVQFGLP